MSAQAEPERALDLPLEMQRLIQIRDREVSAVDSKFLRAVKALRVEMREKQNDLAVRQLDAWLATHSDPILGEWILRQEGNSGKKFIFNKDGSWIRPEKEKQGPMKGKPMEGDWKRQGDRIIIWRAPGYPSDPDKPLAEIKIDIDRGELQWTPLQGKVKMVGKRPADLITPSSKTNSIFKVE